MKIAILSDLHIKEPSFGNKFLFTDDEFSDRLNVLLQSFDKIILNGDIFELWKTVLPLYKYQKYEYLNIKKHFPKSCNTIFNSNKIILLQGNHDNRLITLSKEFPELKKVKNWHIETNSKDEIFSFWHGHLDFFNRIFPYSGFFFTWISGIFERIFSRGSKDYLGIAKIFKKPFFKNSVQIKHFVKHIDMYDNIVFVGNGHTHYEEQKVFIHNNKERIFLNTGFYNKKEQDIYWIDTETKEIGKI